MTQNLAHIHISEFLDESREWMDADVKKRHQLLHRARTVLMEALVALEPKPERAGVSSEPLNFGLETERSPIFETSTDEAGWSSGMIFAIATAKKMGATNFEISVFESQRRPASNYTEESYMRQVLFGQQQPSWQSTATIYKITIYAVRIK
jgi:hypothetical protein